MTLMEVVIAIGVVAFVVPLILATTGSAGRSRLNAEADTRSTWIARQVQREIIAKWATPVQDSVIQTGIAFPSFASKGSPEILAYDSDGNFISKATSQDLDGPSKIPKAVYLVSFYAEAYNPPNSSGTVNNLSLVHISVHHPAKALKTNRSVHRYNLISPSQGTL